MTADALWSGRPGWPALARVEDASQVAGARRLAEQGALEAGFDRAGIDSVALCATELAENLHRHAHQGVLLVDPGAAATAREGELAVLAVDRGPGVRVFARNLRDGVTSAASRLIANAVVSAYGEDSGANAVCRPVRRNSLIGIGPPSRGICQRT